MSSRRRVRFRSCTSKIPRSENEAKSAAYWVWRRKGSDVMAYKCKFCGKWHIGRPTKEKKQALKAKGRQRK